MNMRKTHMVFQPNDSTYHFRTFYRHGMTYYCQRYDARYVGQLESAGRYPEMFTGSEL